MKDLLEVCMVILFGLAWPSSLVKSARARTAKGKSILFLIAVLAGYLCGIASKVVSGTINYVIYFYILNSAMVLTDIYLYIRNSRLDRAREAEGRLS